MSLEKFCVVEELRCGKDRFHADADRCLGRHSEGMVLPLQRSFPPAWRPLWSCRMSSPPFLLKHAPHTSGRLLYPPPPLVWPCQNFAYDEAKYHEEVAKDPKWAVFPDW